MKFYPSVGALPFDRVSGLSPEIWISVGAGFAREDIKSLVLSQGQGFVGEAITTLEELCLRITRISKDRLLSPFSRQEVLRTLLAEPQVLRRMPELKRIRRQRQFVKRLDHALQTGRMAFAHEVEEEVYEERLTQGLRPNPLRAEVRAFAKAYEAWMISSGWFDLSLLVREAIRKLQLGWPSHLSKPAEIWRVSVQSPESLEHEFWDCLGREVTTKFLHSLVEPFEGVRQRVWERWHTLDDAAEELAHRLSEDDAILIPDLPIVRRALKRALDRHELPLADPRDPTRLRWDETLKGALLPLQMVSRQFERQTVLSWIQAREDEFSTPSVLNWSREINSRGIRNGLSSYQGGVLADLYPHLSLLQATLGGRKTCGEVAEAHLRDLRERELGEKELGEKEKAEAPKLWLMPFFEKIWKNLQEDMNLTGQAEKKAPLLFWVEKLQNRLFEATPPIEPLKPSGGIRLYRLQQAPVQSAQRLWIFGLPPVWLSAQGNGSYWYSDRERELLAMDFSVRSPIQVREERLHLLQSWIQGAQQVTFLDAHYESTGRERESLHSLLKELEVQLDEAFPEEPEEKGAHFRFLKSYDALRPFPPQEVQLEPLGSQAPRIRPEISATALDRYSRCSFQALAFHRWNLRDLREPQPDLWPDVRGNLLHEAVRLLLASRDAQGQFIHTPLEALELAWKGRWPQGLLRGERIGKYVKSRLCLVLEKFCEQERDYLKKTGAKTCSLEDLDLRLEYASFSVRGQPDRVDQMEQGLLIMDYKTSGIVPHGSEMVERGYRLQLPFYAIATQKKLHQAVVGAQFIELDRKGGRKSGVFFSRFNGKEEGKITQLRSNSKSLLSAEPDEVWSGLEERLIQAGESYVGGRFQSIPNVEKREKECHSCLVSDLCGLRRVIHE